MVWVRARVSAACARLFCTATAATKSYKNNKGKWRPVPVPVPSSRSIPEPTTMADKDCINIVYSNLSHARWELLNQMASSLTPARVAHVLIKIQNDSQLAQRFFEWAEIHKQHYSHTLQTVSVILHILTRANKFKSAETFIKKHIIDPAPPVEDACQALLNTWRVCGCSPRVFDALFKAYAHSSRLRNARFTFFFMTDYGFLPTIESCNAFLSALSRRSIYDYMWVFYKEMLHRGIQVNSYSLNLIIHGLCRRGMLQKALDVMIKGDAMVGCNVVSYNAIIDGYCKKGLVNHGMKVMKEMMSKGLAPDVITYNAIIHGLCKEGRVDSAHKLFKEMCRMGLSPSTVTYNTLIRASSSETGLRLYEDMFQKGIEVNLLTYNALLHSLCKEGRMRRATSLLNAMATRKYQPNASTFASLIMGYCKRKDVEKAFGYFQKMLRNKFSPTYEIFHTLVLLLCEDGDVQAAAEVLQEMVTRAFVPDLSILDALVNEFCSGNRIKRSAQMLLENVIQNVSDTEYPDESNPSK